MRLVSCDYYKFAFGFMFSCGVHNQCSPLEGTKGSVTPDNLIS